jgi:hypothetical protein
VSGGLDTSALNWLIGGAGPSPRDDDAPRPAAATATAATAVAATAAARSAALKEQNVRVLFESSGVAVRGDAVVKHDPSSARL